eukprot:1136776-Pelagomonas_calceolata.AAC.1
MPQGARHLGVHSFFKPAPPVTEKQCEEQEDEEEEEAEQEQQACTANVELHVHGTQVHDALGTYSYIRLGCA